MCRRIDKEFSHGGCKKEKTKGGSGCEHVNISNSTSEYSRAGSSGNWHSKETKRKLYSERSRISRVAEKSKERKKESKTKKPPVRGYMNSIMFEWYSIHTKHIYIYLYMHMPINSSIT